MKRLLEEASLFFYDDERDLLPFHGVAIISNWNQFTCVDDRVVYFRTLALPT